MGQAQQGDVVKVHYTGKLNDGTVFDSSASGQPLQFTIGEGDVIPGLEQAVIGLAPGESKTVMIPAERAYGPYDDDMLLEVDRTQLPDNLNPEVGQRLQLRDESGDKFVVTVTEVGDSTVTLDGNHPLAGKDLTFDVQLVEIV